MTHQTVQSLWADEALEFPAEISSVITVVDCTRLPQTIQGNAVGQRQILLADLVVLNKTVWSTGPL